MSDAKNNKPKPQAVSDNNLPKKQPVSATQLPTQSSPLDTSNWDDRAFTTPAGRIVIETKQPQEGEIIIRE